MTGSPYYPWQSGDVLTADALNLAIQSSSGPVGPPGPGISAGAGPPTSTTELDGALYLNTNTGDLYEMQVGVWRIIGNLRGPPGPPGDSSSSGIADAPVNSTAYVRNNAAWISGDVRYVMAGAAAGGDLAGLYPNPTLKPTAVAAGSYTYASLTVDAKGRLTAASNGAAPPTARNTARLQAQWVTGATVANDTVWLAYDAPYAGTVNSLTHFTGAGSFTAAIQINGANVTGLSAVTVNSATPATVTATAANTFTAGQRITAVITGATGSPTDALLSLAVTWN